MVLQFFLSLLTVAGIFMVVPYKRRIVWLWLLFTITVCLSVWYLYDMANVARQIIEYKWISLLSSSFVTKCSGKYRTFPQAMC